MSQESAQPQVAWDPVVARQRYAWPENALLAVGIVVSVEYYEMRPQPGAVIPRSLPGGFGRGPYPDFRTFSHREYGNRIGIFRVAELLHRYHLVATAAVDAYTAAQRPEIIDEILRRKWELAGHGQAVTRVISSRLDETTERQAIQATLDAIERVSGHRPGGWHGPEHGESTRTLDLLAELGVRYVLDWPNDELPYTMATRSGPLVSVPMAIDLDDVFAHWHRKLSMTRWARSIAEALDQLLHDGSRHPRALVLNLHPWLIGQPSRISYLEDVLRDLRRREGIWFATAGEIADWHTKGRIAGNRASPARSDK